MGELMCDSLDLAEDADTLSFVITNSEVIVAEKLSYTVTSGEPFTDSIGRKVPGTLGLAPLAVLIGMSGLFWALFYYWEGSSTYRNYVLQYKWRAPFRVAVARSLIVLREYIACLLSCPCCIFLLGRCQKSFN